MPRRKKSVDEKRFARYSIMEKLGAVGKRMMQAELQVKISQTALANLKDGEQYKDTTRSTLGIRERLLSRLTKEVASLETKLHKFDITQ